MTEKISKCLRRLSNRHQSASLHQKRERGDGVTSVSHTSPQTWTEAAVRAGAQRPQTGPEAGGGACPCSPPAPWGQDAWTHGGSGSLAGGWTSLGGRGCHAQAACGTRALRAPAPPPRHCGKSRSRGLPRATASGHRKTATRPPTYSLEDVKALLLGTTQVRGSTGYLQTASSAPRSAASRGVKPTALCAPLRRGRRGPRGRRARCGRWGRTCGARREAEDETEAKADTAEPVSLAAADEPCRRPSRSVGQVTTAAAGSRPRARGRVRGPERVAQQPWKATGGWGGSPGRGPFPPEAHARSVWGTAWWKDREDVHLQVGRASEHKKEGRKYHQEATENWSKRTPSGRQRRRFRSPSGARG